MAANCVETQEWIEEEISKPVDQWVERAEQRCRRRHWYDPRSWLCWLVTTLVKVVVWVAVKVGKWVVRSVCTVTGALLGLLRDLVTGSWDVLVGIFTWDWRRVLDGLTQIVAGSLDSLLTIGRAMFLFDTLDYVVTEIQRGKLKTYVRTKLGFKYFGDDFRNIVDNLRIDHGAFGYRIPMRAIRTYLDSETPSPDEPGVPNLVVLNNNHKINLRELCGFEFTEGFWNRKRYKTLKKGLHAGGGGGGELDDPVSEAELATYLTSRGAIGPKFVVLCMRDGVLRTKLRTAEQKGRELGLMPQWTEETLEVSLAEDIQHKGVTEITQAQELVRFLIKAVKRTANGTDETAALGELCTPVAVGVFRYTETLRGISAWLKTSFCHSSMAEVSGVTFIDNIPDIFWKYVPIHELGHYFGLCHADGLDRIMFSPKGERGKPLSKWEIIKKSLTWWTLPKLLLTKGAPTFTLDEGMQAWDYIIDHFPPACLGAKPAVIL